MKKLGLITSSILLATTLTSCNSDSASSSVPSIEVSVAQSQFVKVNSELNQSQAYSLSKDELDLLLSNNEISQQQYTELLALTK